MAYLTRIVSFQAKTAKTNTDYNVSLFEFTESLNTVDLVH